MGKTLLAIVTGAFRKFYEDDGTFLASGLAFGLLSYSVPFALLSVSALSYTIVRSDTALVLARKNVRKPPHSSENGH